MLFLAIFLVSSVQVGAQSQTGNHPAEQASPLTDAGEDPQSMEVAGEAGPELGESGGGALGDHPFWHSDAFWWDTAAQWTMSAAAILGLFVSGWAVWLVNRTLRETQATAVEAKRSADAANESNRIARHDQRPWLDFKVTDWGRAQVINEGTDADVMSKFPNVEIVNKGRSAAVNVRFHTRVYEGQSFDNTVAVQEVISSMEEGLDNVRVVFPGNDVTLHRWGDIDKIYKLAAPTDSSGRNSWWFLSVLKYHSQGEVYYTIKMFSRPVPTAEDYVEEHGVDFVILSEMHHWEWNDQYL